MAGGAWVAEGVVHGSLFKSGYELLYAPLAPREKRAAKGVIDVGFARLGDMAAGGLAWLAHLRMEEQFLAPLLGGALLFAGASYWIGTRLQRGHVRALERSLVERAAEADIAMDEDALTRTTVFDTMQIRRAAMLEGLPQEAVAAELMDAAPGQAAGAGSEEVVGKATPEPAVDVAPEAAPATEKAPATEATPTPDIDPAAARSGSVPVLDRGAALRDREPLAARAALQSPEPLTAELMGLAIPLLGDPRLASEALLALRRVSGRFIGQLTDALCDPEQPDAVRRRLPRVMSAEPTARAVEGLFCGLDDRRFEVRVQCGLALSRIHAKAPDIEMPEARVLAAVAQEVERERSIWETRQALDRGSESATKAVDRAVHERAGQSLEHVFTLLSLVLPRSNLAIAYQGLYVGDQVLRGTALEYLDAVLPPALRDTLWPFLSDEVPRKGPARPREEILADLNRLNESVVIRIEEIRSLEQ
jgi:hypothetical protein